MNVLGESALYSAVFKGVVSDYSHPATRLQHPDGVADGLVQMVKFAIDLDSYGLKRSGQGLLQIPARYGRRNDVPQREGS